MNKTIIINLLTAMYSLDEFNEKIYNVLEDEDSEYIRRDPNGNYEKINLFNLLFSGENNSITYIKQTENASNEIMFSLLRYLGIEEEYKKEGDLFEAFNNHVLGNKDLDLAYKCLMDIMNDYNE